jgi:hypothetical protein
MALRVNLRRIGSKLAESQVPTASLFPPRAISEPRATG